MGKRRMPARHRNLVKVARLYRVSVVRIATEPGLFHFLLWPRSSANFCHFRFNRIISLGNRYFAQVRAGELTLDDALRQLSEDSKRIVSASE